MIKRDVLLRSEIRTVYSSEKQERMKVYFDLYDKFQQCNEKCQLVGEQDKPQCLSSCERIMDDYAHMLKPRYEENKERLDMEVKNAPLFTSRKRPDRDSLFYRTFGVSFAEVFK